jgi:hypothetical protein
MNEWRYAHAMFVIAAAAAIVAHTPSVEARTPRVEAVATATVRIVSGVRLKLGSVENPGAPPVHDSIVTADGTPRKAKLIEFE